MRIVFRGDSGFCRQRILNYCKRAGVNYIIGLAPNPVLEGITEFLELAMKDSFEKTGLKQREVGEFVYAAQSWARERRMITRLEYGTQGNNPRYVVTNLAGDPKALTTTCTASAARPRTGSRRRRLVCLPRARVASISTATSCACCWQHWVTCSSSGCAPWRSKATALANAQVDTLRIKLLKIAAVVTRNTRRIRLYLASNWPSGVTFCRKCGKAEED